MHGGELEDAHVVTGRLEKHRETGPSVQANQQQGMSGLSEKTDSVLA